MSIERDTGEMVAGAMALGLLLNQKSEDAKDAGYWYNYALNLQSQFNMLQQLSNVQDRVIAEKNASLNEMNAELTKIRGTLSDTKQELSKQIERKKMYSASLDVALEDLRKLRARLVSQSAQTASVTVLYEKLVDEIFEIAEPSKFTCLRAEYLNKTVADVRAKWEESGKLTYAMQFKPRYHED